MILINKSTIMTNIYFNILYLKNAISPYFEVHSHTPLCLVLP